MKPFFLWFDLFKRSFDEIDILMLFTFRVKTTIDQQILAYMQILS